LCGCPFTAVFLLLERLAVGQLPITEYPEVVPTDCGSNCLTTPGAILRFIAENGCQSPLEQEINGGEDMLYYVFTSDLDKRRMTPNRFNLCHSVRMSIAHSLRYKKRVDRAKPRLPQESSALGIVHRKKVIAKI